MSDVSPYGTTQNPDAAAVTANQLVGTLAGSTRENAAIEGVGPALHSTAPYAPQGRKTNPLCAKEGCGNYHLRGEEYCRHHIDRPPS